jgi:dolichyl-phosphate-mannose--protein O-mannosyl transferase
MGRGRSRSHLVCSAKGVPAIHDSPAWARRDWVALAVVTLLGAAVRLPGLSTPRGFVFDEIFYARIACRFVIGTAQCGIDNVVSGAHPPLGNWLIGIGIHFFGYNEFGWRIVAAVAGTLGVALLYLLVRRLLAGQVTAPAATVGAVIGSGLLAVDFLHVVQSRIAMLDVFVTLFVIATVLFVVLDGTRRRGPRGEDADAPAWVRQFSFGRPWRLAAGVALGAATATKWSGGYVALGLVVLIVAWEMAASQDGPGNERLGSRSAFGRALRRELVPSLVLLGLVPLVVYLASYIGRVDGSLLALPWRSGSAWRAILQHQSAMLHFHLGLPGDHPYESAAWSWLLLKRPVVYFFAATTTTHREILAMGNPLTWWGGAVGMTVLAVRWVRRGAALTRPEPVLLAAALGAYLPWLILPGSRSQVFIWYILPTIPFLCAGLGLIAALAWSSTRWRVATGMAALGVAVSFWFFFPVLTAAPLTPETWRSRILFWDCARPGSPAITMPHDQTYFWVRLIENFAVETGPPPSGWCWI